MNIKIKCDRCKKQVEGIIFDSGITAGFYDVAGGWATYGRKNESIVCDSCMHKDPKYRKVYGNSGEICDKLGIETLIGKKG
jgi:hypothetical protein